MIVRILGEGQFHVDDGAADELNELDTKITAAVERDDQEGFKPALDELVTRVRALGTPVDPATLEPSDLILPGEGATMAEVRQMLTGDGLIPG
jgi:hypothetical protein